MTNTPAPLIQAFLQVFDIMPPPVKALVITGVAIGLFFLVLHILWSLS